MATMISTGLTSSEGDGFNLAHKLLKGVLPESNPWSIEYSQAGQHFNCATKVEIKGYTGLLSISIRLSITEDTELFASAITTSRKGSTKTWSGSKYSKVKDAALEHYKKVWKLDLKCNGVRVEF